MKTPVCQWLDDYLNGALNQAEQEEFARHVESCDDCRREVELDSDIDRLLAAAVAGQTVPGDLAPRISARIARQQRGRVAMIALSAAMLACAAIGWLLFDVRSEPAPEPIEQTTQASGRHQPAGGNPEADASGSLGEAGSPDGRPFVHVDLPEDVIGVPVETRNPNVTIIMVYPTVTTALENGSPQSAEP